MKFSPTGVSLPDLSCDLLVVPLFQGKPNENHHFAMLDQRLDGLLAQVVGEEHFEAKPLTTLSLHTQGRVGAQRLLLVGMGPRADFTLPDLRHAGAKAAAAAGKCSARTLAFALPVDHGIPAAAQLLAEGVLLGRYRFDQYLTGQDRPHPDQLEQCLVVAPDLSDEESAVAFQRASIVALAVARARDLVNGPASEVTPRHMAAEAEKLAQKYGLGIEVLGPAACRELGMGMFLAVAQGSAEEPRFIHLSYRPKEATKRVCLVGKGVTFDSGGLSLKPNEAMLDMKSDMAGSAAVISAIAALAELAAPVEVHAFAACTENMPSGTAYKLGDVLRSMAGTTVEINNTDAEGRLTLGDAITYAKRLEPDELLDFATLTGACMVALGPDTAGVMSNNAELSARWLAAARAAGEDMWPLPLPPRLKEMLKSEIADMKNTGERWGGALSAGLFLKEFAGTTPWVHVDLAGPATVDKEYGVFAKGATGFGVATIIEYLTR